MTSLQIFQLRMKLQACDRSQSAHIICYITHDYTPNNRIAQVSPRGGTANGDPPYPRSHPSFFYAKNITNFVQKSLNKLSFCRLFAKRLTLCSLCKSNSKRSFTRNATRKSKFESKSQLISLGL